MIRENKKFRAVLAVILSVSMCFTSVGLVAIISVPAPVYADVSVEKVKYFTVTFKNSDSTIATVQVRNGKSTASDTPKVEETGHTFLGWSTTKGATEQSQVDFKCDTAVLTDKTVYAVFKNNNNVQQSTVTFKVDEGYFNIARVENGKSLGDKMPPVPVKTGYKFLGWSTTKGATKQSQVDFKPDTAVWDDKTVYAVFEREKNMLEVTFKNTNGRDGTVKVEAGEKVIPPICTPNIDYVFVKWCAESDGTAPAFDFSKAITKNVTLYAIYGKMSVPGPEPTPVPIPEPEPTPVPIPEPEPTPVPKPGQYTVTFKNGDQEIASVKVKSGRCIKLANMPKDPERQGYTFIGWSTHKDACKKGDVNFSENTEIYGDTIVYAVFVKTPPTPPVMCDVTFKNEDAWLRTINVKKGEHLRTEQFPAPTKSAYEFIGWSTEKNASKPNFSDQTEVKADTTVYAVFKVKPYKFSYDVVFKSDDVCIKTVQVEDGKNVTATNMPTEPIKSGYKFEGWGTLTAKKADFSAETIVKKDTTVYAIFQKDEHPTKTEVIIGKMTYKPNTEFEYRKTKPISYPVDGKKVTDGSGKVTLNIPAKDGVTEVGNLEKKEYKISVKTEYEYIYSLEAGEKIITEGQEGSGIEEKTYEVDSEKGLTKKVIISKKDEKKKAVNKVILKNLKIQMIAQPLEQQVYEWLEIQPIEIKIAVDEGEKLPKKEELPTFAFDSDWQRKLENIGLKFTPAAPDPNNRKVLAAGTISGVIKEDSLQQELKKTHQITIIGETGASAKERKISKKIQFPSLKITVTRQIATGNKPETSRKLSLYLVAAGLLSLLLFSGRKVLRN